ncbi:MAG TPA: HEXXH motif-containing putative peptide modification protein [Burkholderiales bacterium]|nr:HEXXH motif-containing putative peptide modification protein [Burkholderiales bacterium]
MDPNSTPPQVDWSRMAEPQEDGYDSAVTLALARDEQGWRKADAPDPPTFCDGRVALRLWPFDEVPGKDLVPGPVEHPNLVKAEEYVKTLWPAAYRQFAALVSEVYPMTLRDCDEKRSIGSCSGQNAHRPFTLYVTTFDPFGTAESLLHEMAHIKLRCVGVQVESCTRLILNDPAELYVSPLRSFKRPMTAVAHAFYSWLYLTELGVRLADRDAKRAFLRLPRNFQWIEQMRREIRTHARLDDAGREFFERLYAWADRLLLRGRALAQTA